MMALFIMAFSSKANTYQELKFQVVEGIRVKVDSGPTLVIIDSEDSLLNFYNRYRAIIGKEKIPRIDFSKQMLIGVFLGRRPTGGYSVSVERILYNEKEGHLIVHAVEKCPKPGSIVIQVITYPGVFVSIDKVPVKKVSLELEQCYGKKKEIKKIEKSIDSQE